MSYEIAVVNRDFAMKCREDDMDLGKVMEETPELIPDLDAASIRVIKHFLLFQDNYEIETENSNETIFRHKAEKSVHVNLGKKIVFFKSSRLETWTILSTTALVTVEPGCNIMRFDFQGGHWG